MQTRTAQILVSLLFLTTAISSCDKKEVSPWNQMTEVNNQIVPPVFPERSFVITDYHDVKDTLYTNAINRAITICSEQGGGKVIIPDGEFLTAPIRLKSNVNLHLSDSTVLKFTTDPFFFDLVQTRIEGIDCYNISPLIYAYGETNIAITGNGVMDGQADSSNWFSENRIRGIVQEDGKKINEKTLLYEMKEDSIPFKERVFMRENGIRPQFINLYKCKNILLEGFTLNRSPFWLIHPLLSENITVRKVKMQSHGYNNDGCDPESCRNVLIEDCDFDTGDDCIAIKSGKIYMAQKYNVPTTNMIVRQCCMRDGHGAVTVGSEIAAGVMDVHIKDCLFMNTDRGLRVKTRRGRGKLSVLDDISFENIDMDNVMTPFVVNSFYFCDPDGKTEYVGSKKPLPVDDRTPSIKKFTFKNINAKNCHVAGTYICGLPESKIEELTFENINITYADNAKSGVAAMMLGCDEASRQGMIVSNINTLILDNVKVTGCDGEEIVAENVDNIIKK